MARRRQITQKNIVTYITIFLLIMIIFTWEKREHISPVEDSITHVIIPLQKGVTYFGDWLVQRVDFVKNINILEETAVTLQEEVNRLTYENQILEQSKLELDRLQKLYELDQYYADYPTTGARIIGKDPGNWYNVFIIDKGENQGIKVDMVVMGGIGLIGKIIQVGPDFAKVRSIIDDTSSVSASIVRTDDLCVVKGDLTLFNKGYISIDYISNNVNLLIGDNVITSNLGEIYPPGILIGEVVAIETNENQLSKKAFLKPVVDFKHLKEVLVINQIWGENEEDSDI